MIVELCVCAHIAVLLGMFLSSQSFSGLLCFFFFFYFCLVFSSLVLFFPTPLSFCVALYHRAGSSPCSLDPFCFLASWLTPAHIGCCQLGAWLRGKVFRKL